MPNKLPNYHGCGNFDNYIKFFRLLKQKKRPNIIIGAFFVLRLLKIKIPNKNNIVKQKNLKIYKDTSVPIS